MADPVAGLAVYLQPGMSIKIKAPVDTRDHFGWFAATTPPSTFFDTLPRSTFKQEGALLNGFSVEDSDVGNITQANDEEGAAVVYTHRVGSENAIWFFSLTGEIGLIKIIAVPVHDHSSIVQGGPAYGTYFDDDEEAST